jgi:hypothetical protein
MQVNRLNHLIFPPATPGAAAASTAALQTDSDTDTASTRSASSGVATAPTRKPQAVAAPAVAPETAQPKPGVTLELSSSTKTESSSTYNRDGVLASKARAPAEQTPAEQFVASAVNAMRDFEQGKVSFAGMTNTGAAQGAPASLFGGLRQAVSKLNVFA